MAEDWYNAKQVGLLVLVIALFFLTEAWWHRKSLLERLYPATDYQVLVGQASELRDKGDLTGLRPF
jgi:hypothetical protein